MSEQPVTWWTERGLNPARSMPPRPSMDALPRPRVLARLDAHAERPVVSMVAPAGAGKTTALAQWGRSGPGPIAWCTLDATDDDPATLVRDLLAALAGTGSIPDPGAWPRPHQPLDAPAWLTEHVVLPLHGPGDPVRLVLDDTHAVQSDASWAVVEGLLRDRPARLRLVLAGRTPAPLPLARLEAEGSAARVEAHALWLDEAESDALAERLSSGSLDAAERASLHRRSGGWPAALCLLVKAGPTAGGEVSSRRALDFLAEEIIDAMPEAQRRFVLDTAVTDPLTVPLVEALCLGHPGESTLWSLVDAGLATALGAGVGFRVHPLLREALLRRLATQPERRAAQHGRAARALAQRGLIDEALDHAEVSADAVLLVELAVAHGFGLLRARRMGRLRRLLGAIDPSRRQRSGVLSVLDAWAALGELPAQARQVLAQARANVEAAEPEGIDRDVLRASLSALEGFIALRGGDMPEPSQLRDDAALPPGLVVVLALAEGLAAERAGEPERALASLRRAHGLALALDPPLPSGITALAHEARILRAADRRPEAEAVVQRADAMVQAHGLGALPVVGELQLEQAMLALVAGRPDAAERRAREGLRRLRLGEDRGAVARGLLGLAMIRRAQGDRAAATDALTEAEALARAAGLTPLVEVIARHARAAPPEPVEPKTDPASAEAKLSEREREVLSLVAQGLPNRLVAKQLFISPVTVKTHMHNILGKLSAHNRTEAVHVARRMGLLD